MDPLHFGALDSDNFHRVLHDMNLTPLHQRVHRCHCSSCHEHIDLEPLEGVELDLFLAKHLLLLKPDPLPTSSENYVPNTPDGNFWQAIFALENLCNLIETTEPNSPSSERISQVIRKHWELFRKWMRSGIHRAYAYKHYPLPDDHLGYLITSLNKFMTTLLRFRDLLFATKGDICFKLWCLHLKHPELDKYLDMSPDFFFLELVFYGEYFGKGAFTALEEPIDPCDFSRLVYQRTRKVFSSKNDYKLHPPKLSCHTSFLLAVTETSPEFLKQQIDLGCITLYTGILVRASEDLPRDGSDITHERVTVVERLVRLLARSFTGMEGIDWLRRSIESGLLVGILRAAASMKYDPSQAKPAICILVGIIAKHLVYISILRAFDRAMRKPDHLKAFREVPKAGVFWDSFSEMQEALATHTMALGKAMVRKCNYSGCAQPDLEVSFKRCSGCEDVLYCSVECQKADWTEERHKPYCRERAKSPGDRLAEYAISEDDNTSLEVAFGFDLYRHGLIQNPNIPFHEGEYKNFSHPLVTFDYTMFPPNSTIEEKEDGVPGQLTCVGRFLHGKGGLIFQAELPDPLDNWPLTSASDFHKLRIRKECHP